MVTKEQFFNGLMSYANDEIIAQLPTAGKWGVGTIMLLASSKIDLFYNELSNNTMVKTLGLIDKNGKIDNESLHRALRKSAEQYGNMQITIPIVGVLSFSPADVDKISDYINGGVKR